MFEDAAAAAQPYAELRDVDDDCCAEPADSPLLAPGSDGLLTAPRERLLTALARRREEGASLRQLRRDAGEIDPFVVSDAAFERALDAGRRLRQWEQSGRHTARRRYVRGMGVVRCPCCARRVLERALRRAGCVLCAAGAPDAPAGAGGA